MQATWRNAWVWIVGSVAVLGGNMLVLGPSLAASIGNAQANVVYLGLRVFVLFGLAFGLVRWCGRNRFQAMTSAVLVAFLDQAVFKTLWVVSEIRRDAAAWQETSLVAVVVGLAMSFVIFIPFILMITFGAAQLGANQAEAARSSQA